MFKILFLEFMPYTFQLLAQLLAFHKCGDVSETYTILYPFLLTPALWERTSNIHPLVRLLRSYVLKTSDENKEKSLNVVSTKQCLTCFNLCHKKSLFSFHVLEWTFGCIPKTYCI